MLQGPPAQVLSSSSIVISSSVLCCFQRNRTNRLHKHTEKNPQDTQVNPCLLPSQTANQPVTGQTAQASGTANMLFFRASHNFAAYKTQPHGAHPTHGEIKTPISHWKPIVSRQRPRKPRSESASQARTLKPGLT